LQIGATGDTHIDAHHVVEDLGIVFGQALLTSLGKKQGIRRFGMSSVPMDDVLSSCTVDLSGRAYLHFDAHFTTPKLGDLDTELIHEFFYAVAVNGLMNIHINVPYGQNNHHKAEAIFKSFARALSEAVSIDPDIKGVLSTKGVM